MKHYLVKYKKNLLQIIGLSLGFLLFRKLVLLYIALFLLALLIIAPTYSNLFIHYTDKLISFIGNWIKSVLLFFFFVFIIIPISVLMKIFSKVKTENTDSYFVVKSEVTEKINFEKMW
ncbi:MAG: hypothetical protein U0U67_14260 [Chitinophagales bacterium]